MPTATVCVVFTTVRMRRPPAEFVPIPGRSTWKRFWLTLGKRPGSPVREVPSWLPKSRRNYVDALDAEKRPSEAVAKVVEAAPAPERHGTNRAPFREVSKDHEMAMWEKVGSPGRTRTCDILINSESPEQPERYPDELRAR